MATAKKKAGRPPAEDGGYPRQVGVRLTEQDYERIERLCARVPMGVILRTALMVGVEAIERDPALLLGSPTKRAR